MSLPVTGDSGWLGKEGKGYTAVPKASAAYDPSTSKASLLFETKQVNGDQEGDQQAGKRGQHDRLAACKWAFLIGSALQVSQTESV